MFMRIPFCATRDYSLYHITLRLRSSAPSHTLRCFPFSLALASANGNSASELSKMINGPLRDRTRSRQALWARGASPECSFRRRLRKESVVQLRVHHNALDGHLVRLPDPLHTSLENIGDHQAVHGLVI